MQKMQKWIIPLAWVLLAAVGCSSAPAGTEVTTAGDTTAAVVTTAPEETINEAGEKLEVPDATFDGQEIRFLDVNEKGPNGPYWKTYDLFAENITGETVNDAVWKRNNYIEERFGVKIVETQVNNVVETLTNSILANNDEYDVLYSQATQAGNLTTKQYLYDYADIPYINLSKSWWDQNATAGMSIGNKVYFTTGDIVITDNDATFGLMFNKDLAKNHELENLYELVDSGAWTFEKMYDVMTKTVRDLNGDNTIAWDVDQLGLTSGSISIEALFYASGLRQIKKDKDDLPEFALDVEKTSSFLEKCYQICVDPAVCYNYTVNGGNSGTVKSVFTEGRALFYGETLQGVSRLRDSEVNFGVIPYPKYDEAQDRYYSFVHSVGTVVSVPISNTRLEMTGTIIEAMAAKGQEILTPAYYDITLIGKGLRDQESEPMIDIILANRVYDLGYIFGWGGYQSTIRVLGQQGSTNIASSVQKSQKLFNKALESTLRSIGIE